MDQLYPFIGRFLLIDGLRYHYLDEGNGEPVVLVHGNPAWSFYYRELVRSLRTSRRVIAPDHMGCGHSDKPADGDYDFGLEQRVQDLARLLDHLALERITLVVHDWGGPIGLTWAVRHPERIARLVVMNTAAFVLEARRHLVPLLLRVLQTRAVGALLVRGLNLYMPLAFRIGTARGRLPVDVAAAYVAPYPDCRSRVAVHRFVQAIPLSPQHPNHALLEDLAAQLDSLGRVPMLIVWGRCDALFGAHFLDEWRRRFPGAEVLELPHAGHFVLEDAGTEVTAAVQSFLERTPHH